MKNIKKINWRQRTNQSYDMHGSARKTKSKRRNISKFSEPYCIVYDFVFTNKYVEIFLWEINVWCTINCNFVGLIKTLFENVFGMLFGKKKEFFCLFFFYILVLFWFSNIKNIFFNKKYIFFKYILKINYY
jgi:hypothetical protein